MVSVAKTRALYAPRHPFSEWVTCDIKIARTHPNMSFVPKVVGCACSLRKTKKWFRWQKLVLCMHPTPVFGMGDVRQRNCAKPPPNMSFGPKVVDWACSLRKKKKWFRWQKLVLCMHPDTRFRNG